MKTEPPASPLENLDKAERYIKRALETKPKDRSSAISCLCDAIESVVAHLRDVPAPVAARHPKLKQAINDLLMTSDAVGISAAQIMQVVDIYSQISPVASPSAPTAQPVAPKPAATEALDDEGFCWPKDNQRPSRDECLREGRRREREKLRTAYDIEQQAKFYAMLTEGAEGGK